MSGKEAPEITVECEGLVAERLVIAGARIETDVGFNDLVEKLGNQIRHVPHLKRFVTRSFRSKEDWDLAFMYAKYLRSVEEAFGEADVKQD